MNRAQKRELLAKYKAPPDLELPKSGLVVEVRRPPLAGWIAAGEVPESIFNSAASAINAGTTSSAVKELPEVFALAIKIARAAITWPRLTGEGEQPDEDSLDPNTLPIEDLSTILSWGMAGSPNVEVETTSGPVSVEALESFRPDTELQSGSDDGVQVQSEAVNVAGDKG